MLATKTIIANKTCKRIFFFLLILSFFLVTAWQVIAADKKIELTLNDKQVFVNKGAKLGDVLEEMQIKLSPGVLRDIEGQIINQIGGENPLLTVNGQNASLETVLQPQDRIKVVDGVDKLEEVIEEKIVLPFSVLEKGQGNLLKKVEKGQNGLKVISKGVLSGKVAEEKIVKAPINEVRYYYSKTEKRISGEKALPVYYVGQGKTVALTFDDGPGPYTQEILNILREKGVKGTFFMLGSMVERYPQLARAVWADGHAIGNHTVNHRNLVKTSAKEAEKEILGASAIIEKITGAKVRLFRPPGGHYDEFIQTILQANNLQLSMWSVDTRDWNYLNAQQIEENILHNVKNGSIILMHDGGGNREQTVKALGNVITNLQNAGYDFVTL